MNPDAKIHIAKHRGLVGSALMRNLRQKGYANLVTRTHAELDITQYLAVMPTNLNGPGDNYHPENSHVIPALIRKFHEAKQSQAPTVTVWGTGIPRREFLYSDDMADACVFLMSLPDGQYQTLLGSDEAKTGVFMPPVVNIGVGDDATITELAARDAQTGRHCPHCCCTRNVTHSI